MEDFAKHIKKHTAVVTMSILVAFLLLAAGEYYLYRQVTHLSQMVSEGLFQINTNFNKKDMNTTSVSPSPVKESPTK